MDGGAVKIDGNMVDDPILISPKPLVIEPLFKAPVVTIPEPPAIGE